MDLRMVGRLVGTITAYRSICCIRDLTDLWSRDDAGDHRAVFLPVDLFDSVELMNDSGGDDGDELLEARYSLHSGQVRREGCRVQHNVADTLKEKGVGLFAGSGSGIKF